MRKQTLLCSFSCKGIIEFDEILSAAAKSLWVEGQTNFISHDLMLRERICCLWKAIFFDVYRKIPLKFGLVFRYL